MNQIPFNTLIILMKRFYWKYFISPKNNSLFVPAISVISSILATLHKLFFINSVFGYKLIVPIAFLRYDDLKIYYILNSSIIKSTKYSSICSLNERENISTTLIHYFMKSNKFQLGIQVFEGLTSMDPENIKNWRGLIDLSYYINDQERVTKYFGQFIDFKNKQARSDNVDLDKNLFMSDYYTYSIGHLSFIAEAALIMEITDCGYRIYLPGLDKCRNFESKYLDSITNRFKNIHYVNESDVNQFLYTKKYENPFEFRKSIITNGLTCFQCGT